MDRDKLIAWAGGFIDAEGCIALSRYKNRASTVAYRPFIYNLRVDVSQKVLSPLERLRDLFGGRIYIDKSRTGPAIGHWICQCGVAANVLEEVLPYLLVKREQAEVGIAFQSRKFGRTGRKLRSLESIKADIADWTIISALKRVPEPELSLKVRK